MPPTNGPHAAGDNICAVVVTYHPDAEFPLRLAPLQAQVRQVVIVDNHSEPRAQEMLQHLADSPACQLLCHADNLGIATALNRGIRWAREHGFQWVLTLDQDTVVEPTLVDRLVATYQACPYAGQVGLVAPNYTLGVTGRTIMDDDICRGRTWLPVKTAITSGSLISVAVFDKIGPYRDDFFIDYVDFEFCLRMAALGFKVIMCPSPQMTQFPGQATVHKFLWKTLPVTNYAPLRLYYGARNLVLVGRQFATTQPRWVTRELASFIEKVVYILLYEKSKLAKLSHIMLGVCHGLLGRSGKLPQPRGG